MLSCTLFRKHSVVHRDMLVNIYLRVLIFCILATVRFNIPRIIVFSQICEIEMNKQYQKS